MKTCKRCQKTKSTLDFPKDKKSKDGFRTWCKSCAYEVTIAWNRSKKGIAVRMWHKHIARTKHRGHTAPDYTREWLIDFIINNESYESLYQKYVESGFDKYKAPSIDRIDDNIGYKKDNIRLVSFQENMDHCYDAARKAEHTNSGWEKGCMRPHHAVVQLTTDGDFIQSFISVNEAARKTGCDNSKIPAVCMGKRITHGGYKWMYLEDYENR